MADHIRDDVEMEQRRASRYALVMEVQVRAMGSRQLPAILTSMSRFGCRIVGPGFSKSDQLIWVRIPGLESQPADLRWSDQRGAGLAFRYPLHIAVADRFKAPDLELGRSYRPGRQLTGGFGVLLPC